MDIPQRESNPYAPPTRPFEVQRPEWYLVSACRYYKVMGWVTIATCLTCATPLARPKPFFESSPPVHVWMFAVVTVLFFGSMIRTAKLLPNDFESLYRRARWLGILAGAFGFPILSLPAFLAVSRLATYRTMIQSNEAGSKEEQAVGLSGNAPGPGR